LLPTAVLAGAAVASGIAIVNSVGKPVGFVSAFAIGCIIDTTHSTIAGVSILAGSGRVGGVLALTIPARLLNC